MRRHGVTFGCLTVRGLMVHYLKIVGAMLAGLVLLAATSASAQQKSKLTPAQVEALIKQAIDDPEEIKFARPAILGFPEGTSVVTRQVARTAPNTNYFFAVVVPRVENGLFFFKGTEKPFSYIMHRTDTHLRRVVSARNADGKLSGWTGKAADADFLAQLNYWATLKD